MENIATDAPEIDTNDLVMAKSMAELLHRHYPGHLWAITCEGAKGIATVRNLYLSGQWGFVLKLPEIYSASAFEKEVKMAAGELLERYRISRGTFRPDEHANLSANFAGHFTPDR